ncbi:type II toxin-antitoxin system VapC family toxin [Halosimplex salinum]|uniref:type II toxin-antitoxin system VapC family toxin n=1 Tax=Halosimplex salinum TaxID=1710538 RepID=UPI000F494EFF|nr:type II toxin-antitoxin system VapC family toxin [Halosimplex salinum]
MVCLDANVWIYFLDGTLEEHDAVVDDVRRVLTDEPVFTTAVLQMEVVHYLTNQIAESDSKTERFLSLEDVTTADLTSDDVAAATDLLATHGEVGIGGRDATVVAAMDRYDVSQLWTHDEGLVRLGDRVPWLDVTDPVES